MKKADFSSNANIILLYQNVIHSWFYLSNKSDIKEFNAFVNDQLKLNPEIDIRGSKLTMYFEKINSVYNERKNNCISTLLTLLMVSGTFLMVIATFISIVHK